MGASINVIYKDYCTKGENRKQRRAALFEDDPSIVLLRGVKHRSGVALKRR
jgi:hypothetical protein